MVYFFVFIFKIIEDALATMRLIVVSNGRKLLGSILQFICTIIWVILTGSVLINFMEDFWKVVSFSLGALIGSYIGSFLEEKIALGTNGFIVKIKEDNSSFINRLKLNNYNVLKIRNDVENIIMITAPRKKTKEVVKIIKNVDKDATIISEKVKIFSHL